MPDKEFRYLRTVIVTAAVYWDFDQELSPHHLIFRLNKAVGSLLELGCILECDGFGSC